MRRTLLTALLSGLLLTVSGPALAMNAEPHAQAHREVSDGCDHGATGKPCRQDPQADRGRDCQDHGRFGGRNEDHCLDGDIVVW